MKLRFVVVAALLCCRSLLQASPLEEQVFRGGNLSWVVSPSGIKLYTPDTRIIRPVALRDGTDSIASHGELDGMLWVSTAYGLFQIDLSTQTIEMIPLRTGNAPAGQLAADLDFVWLCARDSLFRYDRLGREWLSFPLPRSAPAIIRITSDGNEVSCLHAGGALVFTVTTEKWTEYTSTRRLSLESPIVVAGGLEPVIFDRHLIHEFNASSKSWSTAEVPGAITDAVTTDSVIYVLSPAGVFSFNRATSLLKPLTTVPAYREGRSIVKVKDTLFVSTNQSLLGYDLKSSATSAIRYDDRFTHGGAEKMMEADGLVLISARGCAVYDPQLGTWQPVESASPKAARRRVWIDREGAGVRYAGDAASTVSGSVEERFRQTAAFAHDSAILTLSRPTPPTSLANVDVHTSLGGSRFLDASFDNTLLDQPPERTLYYRGAHDDRLQSARLGRNRTGLSASPFSEVGYEGGEFTVESRERLETRDRRSLRAAGGGGLRLSAHRTRVLRYRPDNVYRIDSLPDTLRVVPGSLRLTVDGEPVDSSQYTYGSLVNVLSFTRTGLLDPSSVIVASYEVETVPLGGREAFEALPSSHLGRLGYASATVAPRDWVSARAGFLAQPGDSGYQFLSVAVPLELRNEIPHTMLKMEPQFSYDPVSGTQALAGSLQSRIAERATLQLSGAVVDSSFESGSALDYGFGKLEQEYDVAAGYDVTGYLPVSYRHYSRSSLRGTEDRYAGGAVWRRPGLPVLDLELSRHVTEGSLTGPAADSLNQVKDRARVRLYETSSDLLERLLNVPKFGYELALSEFRAGPADDEFRRGRVVYGFGVVSPVKSVSVTGQGTYRYLHADGDADRELTPSVQVQTVSVPRGLDLGGAYTYVHRGDDDLQTSGTVMARSVNVLVKPGEWSGKLGWMNPKARYEQTKTLLYGAARPSPIRVALGQSDVAPFHADVRMIGLDLFPTAELLVRNENQFIETESTDIFTTFNDLKLWIGSATLWQTRWELLDDEVSGRFQQAYTRVDRTWLPWLKTVQGVQGTYVIDSTKTLRGGPQFQCTFTTQTGRVLTSFLNTHSVSLQWTRVDDRIVSGRPDAAYTLMLQSTFYSRLSLKAIAVTSRAVSGNMQFDGRLSLIASL